MKRKSLFLVLLFLVLLLSGYYVWSKMEAPAQPNTQVLPSPISVGQIVPIVNKVFPTQPKTVSFIFEVLPIQTPLTLPLYKIITQNPITVGTKIASSLNITTPPKIIKTNNQVLWENSLYKVSAQTNPSSASFVSRAPTQKGVLPTKEQSRSLILNALSTYGAISPEYSLDKDGVANNFISSGVEASTAVDFDHADYMSIYFDFLLNNNKIILSSGGVGGASALIYPNNSLNRLAFTVLPGLGEQQVVNIYPSSTAMLALQSNKGVLISLSKKDQSYGSLTSTEFSEVQISTINLVYYWDIPQESLFPVYMFSGTITSGGPLNGNIVSYILPAFVN